MIRKSKKRTTRRKFLQNVAGGVLVPAVVKGATPFDRLSSSIDRSRQDGLTAIVALEKGLTRPWLDAGLWANRLQDWRLKNGRIECLAGGQEDLGRTVGILTREIVSGEGAAHLRVLTGTLESSGDGGFSGFLIGVGAGNLDYRSSALAQKASGMAGGFWCGYESDGQIRFREHTDERAPLAYEELSSEQTSEGLGPKRNLNEVVELRLDIKAESNGRFSVTLNAFDAKTGELLAGGIRRDVADRDVTGAVALVSSARPQSVSRARHWFQDLESGGSKVANHASRSLGPILGTLYSLNQNVLKVSVQLMPLSDEEPRTVLFQYRAPGGVWQEVSNAEWGVGYSAVFRMEEWDSSKSWEYRVRYENLSGVQHDYLGVVQQDPRDYDEFAIAHLSCVMPVARSFEGGVGEPELPIAELLGRYTNRNIHFPHADLVRNLSVHEPKLLVFAGDQLYEHSPTRQDESKTQALDYLYKWFLWYWSFGDLTRRVPTIIQTDDHDVYQGNLWGNGGRAAPPKIVDRDGVATRVPDQNRGGYRFSPGFINLVQQTQCGHNPDPYDPTPVEQGIGVYYAKFLYGGISFALLEDRKFKTAPIQGADLDVHEAELLGGRQEAFLRSWAHDKGDVDGRICLTQTVFACVQTSPEGRPLVDWDSNGHPKLQRDRAIALLRDAGALVLAGDQHLASIVRHGIDSHTDGVVQYTGPATLSFWQRWFEPRTGLPNAKGRHTGDFVDAFGNRLRVHAVANPKISFDYYRRFKPGRSQALGDTRLKSEGYGIIRVQKLQKKYVIECWPRDVDPRGSDAAQFPGWPFHLRFDECDGRALD